MGVPNRLRSALYSHMARPHPYFFVTWSMWVTMSWSSGYPALRSTPE